MSMQKYYFSYFGNFFNKNEIKLKNSHTINVNYIQYFGWIVSISILMSAISFHSALARENAAGSTRGALLERRLAGPDGSIMVVAHRGCWKGSSENSLDAIRACIAAGVDMVELDVRATRDGTLILMHDATVDRMTDGTGKVEDMDWADLKKLHLRQGGGKDAPLTSRHIPTFEEALRAAKDKILINVDAKILLSSTILQQIDVVGSRKQILFKAEAPYARLMADAPWVQTLRFQPILREPNIKVDPAGNIAAYDPIRPVSYEIDVKNRAFTPLLTKAIQDRCARYWVNSLSGRIYDDRDAVTNPDAVWGELVRLGVNAIQTDEPILLKNYLNRTDARGQQCEPAPVG
ncbi:MAG: glycerophosphodiester phosphodiesterase family protein [Sphingobium sp.]|nr:glycerophosphodiester phosphodiesterase family protein [Sphingobium sp.]